MAATFSVCAQPITNLSQLSASLGSTNTRVYRDLRLEVLVCAASRPKVGAFIVQDSSGAELLELGRRKEEILPGDRIRIEGQRCLLRRRSVGIEISAPPVVDNDGLHDQTANGEVILKAGLIPLQLDCYNCTRAYILEVSCRQPGGQALDIPGSVFYQPEPSKGTNLVHGLRAECFEGYWENVPDFQLLRVVKNGVTTNFDLQFKTRDEMVGIRFTGYFNAPGDGQYSFRIHSDDGSLLFLGDPEVSVVKLWATNVPTAKAGILGEALDSLDERWWTTVEGRIGFISKLGEGLEFELRSERNSVRVKLADSGNLDASQLLNSRVRVTGVGSGVLATDQRLVLGQLVVASTNELSLLEQRPGEGKLPPLLDTARQVQSLRLEDAKQGLPVRIRGVVTSVSLPLQYWQSVQDNERGIFVDTHSITNLVPARGELWEIVGHTGAGDFAPIVIADQMKFLGPGRMPEPARPTWNELNNGTMDVQWVEFQGLVTEVQSNRLTLLLPEGHLDVQMDEYYESDSNLLQNAVARIHSKYYESDLKPFQNAVVRIRGTLFAVWNSATREVRVGQILMRNAIISVDIPAPADPFDAPAKTPSDLFLFDAQASAFQRIKVRGQVIHAEATRVFLMERGLGLQVLPVETVKAHAGDIVEAVGYPEISGPSPLLREAIVRKIGTADLPAATLLTENELTRAGLDSTRVRVEGKLLGWHLERGVVVLEMQSGRHLYFARVSPNPGKGNFSLRAGSHLALNGVYVGQGDSQSETGGESFHLLLNSSADITVLSQPSWWTLQRLLIIVGVLLVVLMFALLWITQLRRLVEQRTNQLQCEIRERERIEGQHALEAERSRIARDLHDDLGSSLTEIGVLASTGQRPLTGEGTYQSLFGAIANKSRNLIAALDVIVWAVDPAENSLQSLADYLSGYTGEYFSHANISCRFKVPVSFPPITLDGRTRHELFMSVKEALNNVVRHAGATEVEFQMAVNDNALSIVITDNGKGFEPHIEQEGYGLKNLSQRLKKLGGSCVMESRIGGGTTVKIHLPLPVQGGTKPDIAQN